jgi:hypothetical protein
VEVVLTIDIPETKFFTDDFKETFVLILRGIIII